MTVTSTQARRARPKFTLRAIAAIATAATLATLAGRAGTAEGPDGARAAIEVPIPDPILTSNELLGEAAPDECFVDIGVDYPPINPDGTCNEGTPKTNESYIWGLTQAGSKLWFGTMANTACIVSGESALAERGGSGAYVCEFGQSQYARTFPAIPDAVGDWRPPGIYEYDLTADELVRRDDLNDPLLYRTLGFRGAGSIGNIAFLAGPHLLANHVNMFAFESDTGEYLGSCELQAYSYIRKWELAGGVLYVGAGSAAGGAVLRWDGDADSFAGDFCADFTEVGRLTAHAANVVIYRGADGEDRLAATTVPITNGLGVGVWISPPLGPDGLTPDDADAWRQVWSVLSYEPDLIVALFGYSGGAAIYYNGWLYWGTIHLQKSAAYSVHQNCTFSFCFGIPATPEEEQALADGVYRTASVWRGRNLEDPRTREIQLLYGESELPACNGPHSFEMVPTGWTPLYGPSGFGNRGNEYIWQMAILDGRLFVGTYDASVFQGAPDVGADLWRFDSTDAPAVNEDYRGLGDVLNYGIRALVTLDDQSGLIAGMANPFNLHPNGGWELRRLMESPPAAR